MVQNSVLMTIFCHNGFSRLSPRKQEVSSFHGHNSSVPMATTVDDITAWEGDTSTRGQMTQHLSVMSVLHSALAWSAQRWPGPLSAGLVRSALAWSAQPWPGPLSAGLVRSALAWSAQRWPGPLSAGLVRSALAWSAQL
ncbi:hypothetical protein NHX12_030743 [Muraenolepis orangiensis]|uniref:Uncharacterized protein n=1 Tax=Muraenolepis orangiensis TaxID=630683 RepID=A0A9Q0EAG3_9TELE|nr:hypothetical protein NHX12_030743 [Muraenolepis orangiensis]